MDKDSKKRERRRRTCADEWRRDLARRRERRSDPAGKVMLQLLALLSAVLALAPSPELAARPSLPRRSRYDPPAGYALGREAWARERGLDPEHGDVVAATEKPAPRLRRELRSWRDLVRDLDSRSPQRRESARELLMKRVPEAAHEWLRQLIASGERTQLRILGLGASAEVLRERALQAARVRSVWEPEETPSPEPGDEAIPGPGPGRR